MIAECEEEDMADPTHELLMRMDNKLDDVRDRLARVEERQDAHGERIDEIKEKVKSSTFAPLTEHDQLADEHDALEIRVGTLEQTHQTEVAERRGVWKTLTLLGSACLAIGGMFGWLGEKLLDALWKMATTKH